MSYEITYSKEADKYLNGIDEKNKSVFVSHAMGINQAHSKYGVTAGLKMYNFYRFICVQSI